MEPLKNIYPGTCRNIDYLEARKRQDSGEKFTLRLNMDLAIKSTGKLSWNDLRKGNQIANPKLLGDVILARKDIPTSYHLSVTVDDHIQGITLVTRAEDLEETTGLHRLLQVLLGYNEPSYLHHPLILDQNGKRFAKRNNSATLASLRNCGVKADYLRKVVSRSNIEEISNIAV